MSGSEHSKVAGGDPGRPTPEEAMAIPSGSIAYTSTYPMDENTKTINPNVRGARFQILLKLLTSARSLYSLPPTIPHARRCDIGVRVEVGKVTV